MQLFTFALFLLATVVSSYHFKSSSKMNNNNRFLSKVNRIQSIRLRDSNIEPSGIKVEGIQQQVPEIVETAEEKYKREKLAEIAEKKAAEVFMTRNTGRYECQACGYIYSEAEGYAKRGIAPGTSFDNVENFRCPQCGVGKNYFVAETETLSGFKENLKYGFGGNGLTGGQKSNLIFGGLFIGFAIFMSGYLLE